MLFSVSDEGIGIPENRFTKIFDRFAQADDSVTRRYGGSGLGLSISKKLVELMNGKIWVESAVGKGSDFKFIVELPLNHNKVHLIPPYVRQDENTACMELKTLRQLHILIAEDSPDNQLVMQGFLEKYSHILKIVENGEEAFDVFINNKFDLVFMDIQMPILNGYSATKKIRQWEIANNKVATPIIALSAHVFEENIMESKNAGCNEHLDKPITKKKLLALIERYTQMQEE